VRLESLPWKHVLELYEWDRLEEAFQSAESAGMGYGGAYARWYRSLEAEYVTRVRGQRKKLNDWLEFEWVPEALGDRLAVLEATALSGCDEVASRLGWQHEAATLITILSEEADTPWATLPYGYCVDKYPYEKICLPHRLVGDLRQFKQAVVHEYAHVICLNLTLGRAPRWLEEAVSVLAEWNFDPEMLERFRRGSQQWLKPGVLEAVLEAYQEEATGAVTLWGAYQQAGWIGRYLTSLGDEKRLASLLREHRNESVRKNLWSLLRGSNRTDLALREIYGLSESQVFRNTLNWLMTSRF
jgi:hypothetical protein